MCSVGVCLLGADECACNGAGQHAVPASVLRDLEFRKAAAHGVQNMMVEILKVRRMRAPAQAAISDDVEAEHELAHLSDDPYMQESVPSDAG